MQVEGKALGAQVALAKTVILKIVALANCSGASEECKG